ncbi:hypothetical protein F3Y22_tig00110223pilonHSYRG00234 [Hibiscus syriacus]|uniref:Uncharacterized protein n=1 Tax=Hibiscus syriacus TaxID=106335 RepID=A0A6A3BA35_HIBSY|nr:hypothetical protein F3Y22_tig00110223pilonHSYRG00234 [Hibiscus syriacus]
MRRSSPFGFGPQDRAPMHTASGSYRTWTTFPTIGDVEEASLAVGWAMDVAVAVAGIWEAVF